MRDPRLDKLAGVVVGHCARVAPGDLVAIVAEPACTEGVEAVFEAVLKSGAHPSFHPRAERLQQITLMHANDDQVRHVCPFEEFRLARCDALIVLRSTQNSRFLGGLDSTKAAMMQAARRGLVAGSMRRSAAGALKYVLTELPSSAAAQDAAMSLTQHTDHLFRAGFLHLPDPIGAWRSLHERQERLCHFLQSARTLRFRSPLAGGTDVSVDVSGRMWVNCAAGQNFPDGEVFSGPCSVDGVVSFSYPAIYRGREVDGIRIRFKGGRAVDATATKNEEYLHHLLAQDAGASVVGEVGIGTNFQLSEFCNNTFLDEKIGGTFHLALGAGYPETGNKNESGLHWDLVTDLRQGGTIDADGAAIQRNGRFTDAEWPQV